MTVRKKLTFKGFGVRIRKNSASYIVMYRNVYGKQKKVTIAKTTQITPSQAREEAKQILALVVQGKDPQNDRIKKQTNRLSEPPMSSAKKSPSK